MSAASIQAAREGRRRGQLETNRWGVLLNEATAIRARLRRGAAGDDPAAPLVDAFERFLVPVNEDGAAATGGDRAANLGYLADVAIAIDGDGSSAQYADFFAYATDFDGDLGSFATSFESFVGAATGQGGTGSPPDADAVASAFETAATNAIGTDSTPSPAFTELIDVLEAGVVAAREHRDSYEAQLTNEFEGGSRTTTGLLQQFHDGLGDAETPYSEALFETLGEHPIAMLPVALETSFHELDGEDGTADGSGSSDGDRDRELRVRVYPDDLHVDTHEPELTTDEERWGKEFWTQVHVGRFRRTQPGSDPPLPEGPVLETVPDAFEDVARRTLWADSGREGTTFADYSDDAGARYDEIKARAWQLLLERVDRERAAYVVRRTEPVDTSSAGDPETASALLAGPAEGSDATAANDGVDDLQFEAVANRPDTWTRQPRARYLPERWLVRLEWTDADTHRSAWVHADHTVDEPLYVGPEPDPVEAARADRDADEGPPGTRRETETPNDATEAVDAGMEWMVDFAAAERRGMALRVDADDLGTATLPDQFDRVTVTGVRAAKFASAATDELSELLAHQQYTDGVELLSGGTPTNNHDGTSSGYRGSEPPEESLAIEVDEPLTGPTDPTDGTLLAHALGLSTTDGHPFAHVEGAGDTEWLDARLLQEALFPGTLGYALKQLLVPDAIYEGSANDAERRAAEQRYEAIRDHLLAYVRAEGPLPALRIDDQPYGILPATSLSADDSGDAGDPADGAALLREIVQFLRPYWLEGASTVPTAAAGPGGSADGSPLERVRQVLQRGAVADAYTRRLFLEERGGDVPGVTGTLRSYGHDYDPRVGRLTEFGVSTVGERSEYGHGEYFAPGDEDDPRDGYGTDSPSLITTVARPDPANEFLGALPRMLNSDLLKFGREPHLERFPGFVSVAYHDQSPVRSWGGLADVLDEAVDEPLIRWLAGDVEEPAIGLFRLVDRTGEGVFAEASDDGYGMPDSDGTGSVDLSVTAAMADEIVEYVLTEGGEEPLDADLSAVEQARAIAALEVLFVDALDRWLGTHSVDFGPLSGDQPAMEQIDGTDMTADDIADLETKLREKLEQAYEDPVVDWPTGSERLRRFYEATEQAVLPDDAEDADRQLLAPLIEEFCGKLLEKHLVDYVVLGTTIRGSASEYFPHTHAGEAGENVVPTTARKVEHGDRPSFEAKRLHDTALLPQLLRFSTINAGLDALAAIDGDGIADSQLFERTGGGRGRFDVFTNNTSRSLYEAWGYVSDAQWGGGAHDEIVDGFAGTKWYGLLNAMRYEQFVGKDETPDAFQAFQASLEWLAGTAEGPAWARHDHLLAPERIEDTRRLTAGTLDLASHRLDAWWTSLATRRLAALRSDGEDAFDVDPSAVWGNETPDEHQDTYEPDWSTLSLPAPSGNTETYVGAYGFVEDLVRDEATVTEDHERFERERVEGPDQDEAEQSLEEPVVTAAGIETALEDVQWLDQPPTTDGGTTPEAEYVQAPSIPQATTAAILRSGHRSEPSAGFSDTLAIDLSPLRVQKAQWVLDGLRAGLWLGELMGYYFERRLHEVGEDTGVTVEKHLTDFREYAPFQGDEIDHDEDGSVDASTTGGGGADDDADDDGSATDDDGSTAEDDGSTTDDATSEADGESTEDGDSDGGDGASGDGTGAKYDLVDGYQLYTEANEGSVQDVLDAVGVQGAAVREWTATVLGEVDEILDALADLIVAENVHQLQQGNFGRAGRSLKALSEGKHPRTPEVLDTQRESVGVTHRLLVLFGLDGDPPGSGVDLPGHWQAGRSVTVPSIADDGSLATEGPDGTPRTERQQLVVRDDGAPILNGFAGDLLPDPGDVRCHAIYRWETEREGSDWATTATEHEVVVEGGVSLADLDQSPLDALYLTQQAGEAGASKLENHVAYHLLRRRDDHAPADRTIPPDAELDLRFRERPSGEPDATTFGEFVEHARSLRDLVLDTRPANATDLGHPGDEVRGERIAAQPVIDRATTATDRLRQVRDVLENRIPVVDVAEPSEGDGSGGPSVASGGTSVGSGSTSVGNGRSTIGSTGPSVGSGGISVGSGGPSGGSGGTSDSDATAIVPPVAAFETALEALADDVPLSSMESAARGLKGSELRTELATLLDYLPAGPIDADSADEAILVEQEAAPVAFDVPVARADAFVPATQVELTGRHGDGTDAWIVDATDPETGTERRFQVPNAGEDEEHFEMTLDLGPFAAGPGEPFRRIELEIVEGLGEFLAVEPGRRHGDADPDDAWTVGIVPDEEVAAAFADDRAAATVRVASSSPSSRFKPAPATEQIAPDGTCATEIDASGVQVGTAFDAVATLEDGSGTTHLLGTKRGRVVGSDPANGIDDALLGDMHSLPRLMWLAGFETELAHRGPGAGADGPSLAWTLEDRLTDVPWDAIDRERALFPTTNTTWDQPKRDAVAALASCSDVALRRASDALTGSPNDRGIAPLVDVLALRRAVTVVGRSDPFGEQTYFAPEDAAGLAEARDRIEAFLRDPWPSDVAWADASWLIVDSGLASRIREARLEGEFEALLRLVEDDAWGPGTLAPLVETPGELVAAVGDLLYHPGERASDVEQTVGEMLQELAETARTAGANTPAAAALDGFDAVSNPVTDVADPLSALGTFLAGATVRSGSGAETTFDSTVAGWTTDVADELSQLVDALDEASLAASLREGLLETLRRPMVRAAFFGVYGAIPAEASGGSETARRNLATQARAVLETIAERLPDTDPDDPDDAPADLEAAIERLESIFGEEYTVLPPFTPGNLAEVTRTFDDGDLLADPDAASDPLPVQTWFQRSARVRERPQMLRETLLYGEIATDSPQVRFDVGQLPFEPDDSWVGLDGVRPGGRDRVSLVAHTDEGFDAIVEGTAAGPARMVAGLAVDEWVEEVPAQEETTSVAVRYDEPDNEPPQSILLATPPEPDGGTPWTRSRLGSTVDETVAMTRARGVTLEDLRPEDDQDRWMLGTLLPALYFAQDTHVQPNTPSLDLTSLDRFEDEAGSLEFAPWMTGSPTVFAEAYRPEATVVADMEILDHDEAGTTEDGDDAEGAGDGTDADGGQSGGDDA